jgi:hypothetical protein
MSLPLASIDSLTSRLVLRYPRGSTLYVTRPTRSIVSRSLPLARPLPHGFTGHVARPTRSILSLIIGLALCAGSVSAAEPDPEEYQKDSGAGLPGEYAKNYLVRKSSVSPGEKFALIYPTREFGESKEAKDFLVALNPFRVLATLPTDADDKSNSALGAEWSGDGSTALITLDSKWGPADIWLVELADEKVKRMTNLLEKVRELLRPRFRAVKPKPTAYNNANEFIFEEEEGGACQFAEKGLVRIYTKVTNDPKGISKRPWRVLVDAEWDIAQAKFVSQKITPEKRR